mmetsp:Transcript_6330/g.15691  ORF Transcript_6330/g.15691 Transcript_6330/m.15691 type:complete len:92 (-) Transcript_6330:261-536(-)
MVTITPGQQMQYDPEEIRRWKKLIYGTHMVDNKVDEWVSNGQESRKSGRRKSKGTSSKSYSNNDSFSNSYSQDDWLSSPSTPKRNYRNKKY